MDKLTEKPSCSTVLSFDQPALEFEMGVGSKVFPGQLLTDGFIIWGDDFRFYELGDSYLVDILE